LRNATSISLWGNEEFNSYIPRSTGARLSLRVYRIPSYKLFAFKSYVYSTLLLSTTMSEPKKVLYEVLSLRHVPGTVILKQGSKSMLEDSTGPALCAPSSRQELLDAVRKSLKEQGCVGLRPVSSSVHTMMFHVVRAPYDANQRSLSSVLTATYPDGLEVINHIESMDVNAEQVLTDAQRHCEKEIKRMNYELAQPVRDIFDLNLSDTLPLPAPTAPVDIKDRVSIVEAALSPQSPCGFLSINVLGDKLKSGAKPFGVKLNELNDAENELVFIVVFCDALEEKSEKPKLFASLWAVSLKTATCRPCMSSKVPYRGAYHVFCMCDRLAREVKQEFLAAVDDMKSPGRYDPTGLVGLDPGVLDQDTTTELLIRAVLQSPVDLSGSHMAVDIQAILNEKEKATSLFAMHLGFPKCKASKALCSAVSVLRRTDKGEVGVATIWVVIANPKTGKGEIVQYLGWDTVNVYSAFVICRTLSRSVHIGAFDAYVDDVLSPAVESKKKDEEKSKGKKRVLVKTLDLDFYKLLLDCDTEDDAIRKLVGGKISDECIESLSDIRCHTMCDPSQGNLILNEAIHESHLDKMKGPSMKELMDRIRCLTLTLRFYVTCHNNSKKEEEKASSLHRMMVLYGAILILVKRAAELREDESASPTGQGKRKSEALEPEEESGDEDDEEDDDDDDEDMGNTESDTGVKKRKVASEPAGRKL
jgi:hypothetical protein